MLIGAKANLGSCAAVAVAGWFMLVPAQVARAQESGSSVQQREAAAEAYDYGSAAYLAGEYDKAAKWFETAHRLAPASTALLQAISAHDRAGNKRRAASLALRLANEYPEDTRSAEAAQEVLKAVRDKYVQVNVECADCQVELDGSLQEYPSFLLEPDTTHQIIAHFDTGNVTKEISGRAGGTITVPIEAPEPAPKPEPKTVKPASGDSSSLELGAPGEQADTSGGLPPALAFTAIGATAIVGGVALWSFIDMRAGVAEYERKATACNPPPHLSIPPDPSMCPEAMQRFSEGQKKEKRTTILGITTGAVGAATLLALVLTNWSGSDDEEFVQAWVVPTPGGAAALVRTRF